MGPNPDHGAARFGDGLATVAAGGSAGGEGLAGAAREAAEAAVDGLGGTPDLVAVFVSVGGMVAADQGARIGAAVGAAAEVAGARHGIGCLAGGVIGDGRGVEHEQAVAVWAGVLPGATVRPFTLTAEPADGGLRVVGLPAAAPDDRVGVVLADPFTFPIGPFVDHSNADRPGLPLVGGLAGGPGGPGSPRLFVDGEVSAAGAVGVLLGGDLDVRAVVSQGCRPVGPPMVVTGADRNLLTGLAGVPAYAKLRDVVQSLPPDEQQLVARGLHLGIVWDEYADEHRRGDFLIRGVLGVNEEAGAVAVGDVVAVGQTVQFQVRDADTAGEDLTTLLAGCVADGPVTGALLFSCNGRGAAMFPDAGHDVRLVRSGLGTGGVGGFFAGGEIGPVGGRNHLHGFTASVLAFG